MPFDQFSEDGDGFGGGIGPDISIRIERGNIGGTMSVSVNLTGDWESLWTEIDQAMTDYLEGIEFWTMETKYEYQQIFLQAYLGQDNPSSALDDLKAEILKISPLTLFLTNLPSNEHPEPGV